MKLNEKYFKQKTELTTSHLDEQPHKITFITRIKVSYNCKTHLVKKILTLLFQFSSNILNLNVYYYRKPLK